jgi:hypothetical protein
MTEPVSAGHTVAPSQPGLVPSAARRQADEANRLIAQLNAPAQAPTATAQPAASAQPARAPAPPPPNPELVAAPPEDLAERLRKSEARFATLQGKYNSETTVLREQLNQNTALVTQLLERSAPAAPAAPAPAPVSPEDRMRSLGATDKDIEEYGDLLPLVARLAENMVRPTLAKLEGELAKVQRSQAGTTQAVAQSRTESLYAQLDAAVPTWRVINESQEFLDWLTITDIFSGVTRQVALTDAFKKLDAARVVGIFEAYAREYPAEARAPGAPLVDPATLAAPQLRGAPVAAPEGAGGKRMWAESEITEFYAKVRKKLVGPEEYKRMMAEIARASAEGRIQPTRRVRHANE